MNLNTLKEIMTRLNAAEGAAATQEIMDELSPDELTDVAAFLEWRAARPSPHRRMKVLAGMAVLHLDGNPLNNEPTNLRVVDPRENRRAESRA